MRMLPEGSNFFGSVRTRLRAEEVARLLAPPVWNVRRCSWTDFEAASDFAELVIETSDPVLFHGRVADPAVNWRRIVQPFIAAGLCGSMECYDDDGALIFEQLFGEGGESRE